MRIFTDKFGNFNWAAVGGVCAVIGSALALTTFFSSSGADASAENVSTVLIHNFDGDKVEGITLEQYEAGLVRREQEVLERLKDTSLDGGEAKALRTALQKIDERQSDLDTAYKDVAKLTADIRAYHENSPNPELVQEAIGALFDGNTANAARLSIKAGIPVDSVGTIESLTRVFQLIETETDFIKYVADRDLILSNNTFYKAVIGRSGSLEGFFSMTRTLSGSWAWIDGKYCREFAWKGKHYDEHCATISATKSAVKIADETGTVQIYSIKN